MTGQLVAPFVRSGYFVLRSLGEGGLKKSESESECESNREHSHLFFLIASTEASAKVEDSLSHSHFSLWQALHCQILGPIVIR